MTLGVCLSELNDLCDLWALTYLSLMTSVTSGHGPIWDKWPLWPVGTDLSKPNDLCDLRSRTALWPASTDLPGELIFRRVGSAHNPVRKTRGVAAQTTLNNKQSHFPNQIQKSPDWRKNAAVRIVHFTLTFSTLYILLQIPKTNRTIASQNSYWRIQSSLKIDTLGYRLTILQPSGQVDKRNGQFFYHHFHTLSHSGGGGRVATEKGGGGFRSKWKVPTVNRT